MSFSLLGTKDPWVTWAWISANFLTTYRVLGLLKLNSAHVDDVDLLASIQFLVLSSKFAYGISLPAMAVSSISFAWSLLCLLTNLAFAVLFFCTKAFHSSYVNHAPFS